MKTCCVNEVLSVVDVLYKCRYMYNVDHKNEIKKQNKVFGVVTIVIIMRFSTFEKSLFDHHFQHFE